MAADADKDNRVWGFYAVVPAAPGVLCVVAAFLADAFGAEGTPGGFGRVQTVLLVGGVMLALYGLMVHRKAARDTRNGVRGYWRTVSFLGVLTLLAVAVVGVGLEVACRFATPPVARHDYRMFDETLGWALVPNRTYRVTSRAKGFDVLVEINASGFREDGQNISSPGQADVVVIGDSNAFGFGMKSDETLSHRIHRELGSESVEARVLNAGVPGYGLGQFRLRLKGLDLRRPGPVVVMLVHPVNDLVNLSCDVDYGHAKPCTTLAGDRLAVLPPRDIARGVQRHFGAMFDELNAVFKLPAPKARPADAGSRLALLDVIRGRRVFLPQPPGAGETTLLADARTAQQYAADRAALVESDPPLWCSRSWPEIAQFGRQRMRLRALARRVLADADDYAESLGGHLVVVVAEEPVRKHAYWIQRSDRLAELFPDYTFEWGWSEAALTGLLDELDIPYVHVKYPAKDVERMLVPLDEHASAEAFNRMARDVSDLILKHRWLPRRGN